MKKFINLKYMLCFCLLFASIAGCDGGGDGDGSCTDCDSSEIEGRAFFPYNDNGLYPVYFGYGNYDITVVLHDEDDVPVFILDKTEDDGYFSFTGLSSGWYFVTAYIDVYNEHTNTYTMYQAKSDDIYVGRNERILEVRLELI